MTESAWEGGGSTYMRMRRKGREESLAGAWELEHGWRTYGRSWEGRQGRMEGACRVGAKTYGRRRWKGREGKMEGAWEGEGGRMGGGGMKGGSKG